MGEFHRALADGSTPATALRAAKLAIRRRLSTAHPFHWVGFVLARGAAVSAPTTQPPSAP